MDFERNQKKGRMSSQKGKHQKTEDSIALSVRIKCGCYTEYSLFLQTMKNLKESLHHQKAC